MSYDCSMLVPWVASIAVAMIVDLVTAEMLGSGGFTERRLWVDIDQASIPQLLLGVDASAEVDSLGQIYLVPGPSMSLQELSVYVDEVGIDREPVR